MTWSCTWTWTRPTSPPYVATDLSSLIATDFAGQDELMEEAEEIFWRRAPPRLRLAATPSIVARIFHFAMQARGNEVVMPGNTRNVVAAGLRMQVMAIK